jgi:hypothetical protein
VFELTAYALQTPYFLRARPRLTRRLPYLILRGPPSACPVGVTPTWFQPAQRPRLVPHSPPDYTTCCHAFGVEVRDRLIASRSASAFVPGQP